MTEGWIIFIVVLWVGIGATVMMKREQYKELSYGLIGLLVIILLAYLQVKYHIIDPIDQYTN